MRSNIEERCIEEGLYIVETGATVRKAGEKFNVGKSTIYMDITKRLKKVAPILYRRVMNVLQNNKAERHIRGGMATKNKFKK